jgi:hypothetical protein
MSAPTSLDQGRPAAAASTAKEEAGSLAGLAADSSAQVAHVAKDQATEVAAQAASQAKDLLAQAKTELSGQASAQQQRAAAGLRALGDELRSMTSHDGQAGVATDLAGQGAERAHAAAQWLEDREPGSLVTELQDLARRRPLAFLAAAAGAGLLAGRLTRGIAAGAPDTADDETAAAALPPGLEIPSTQMPVRPFATSDFTPEDQEIAGLGAIGAEYPLTAGESPADGILGARPVGGVDGPR